MSTAAPSAEGMRILVVHNRYRSLMPSGENRVVDDEVEMLRDAGLVVETFFRDSDDIETFGLLRKAALAVSPTYSAEAVRDFRRVLAEFRPDVVHLHNPFPLISPWVVRVAKHAGIPVVQTVHNYRMSCPAGTFFRDGQICEDCTGKAFPWPAVQHGCYRGSRAQSLSMAVAQGVHESTWRHVSRFVAISDFVGDKLVAAGIPRSGVTVRANPVPDPGATKPLGDGFLYAGRLEIEKGISLLLDAWRESRLGQTTALTIAGHGRAIDLVRHRCAHEPGAHYVGYEPNIGALMDAAAVIVAPSIWAEPFGLTVAEAMSRGRGVVTTPYGAPPSLIGDGAGWVGAATPAGLAAALVEASDRQAAARAGECARQRYATLLSPGRGLEQLLATYQSAIADRRIPDAA